MGSRLFLLGFVLFTALSAFSKTPVESGARRDTASAIKTGQAPAGLDEKRIHTAYMDGDFETVIAGIEAFTKTHRAYAKSDSVFIAKHLAVVYTANPATREKGKNYMFRLLELLPSAKIVDMFVSDEIDHIFERVREEYVIRMSSLGKPVPSLNGADSSAVLTKDARNGSQPPSLPGPSPESSPTASSSMGPTGPTPVSAKQSQPRSASEKSPFRIRPVYWWAGSAAVLAATGTIAYLVMTDTHATKETTYDIPH